MLLPRVVAAFWAADNTEEKKPEDAVDGPELPEGLGEEAFSGVGVSGAVVVLDSLLGPMRPGPD